MEGRYRAQSCPPCHLQMTAVHAGLCGKKPLISVDYDKRNIGVVIPLNS